MKAILLLGGLGTRLRPFTLHRPKPLLPVLNRPIFFYQLAQVKAAGVREVVLALGHKAAHFKRFLGTGKSWGVRFRYSIEKEPLGTGGAIGLAARFCDEPTLVLNGDILSDLDLKAFTAFHRRKKAEVSLALTPVKDPSAFGVIETGPDGRVLSFTEKPAPGTEKANTINAGFYLFEPSVREAIPAGRPVSIERETFPALLAGGRRLFGFRHKGFWADVGTLPSYARVHEDLLARYPAWARRFGLSGRRLRPGVWAGKNAAVHPSASLRGRILLGDGVRVGAGASLSGFVCLGDGATVGEGARVSDSVLHAGVRVGPDGVLQGVLAGEKSLFNPGARPASGTVLGAGEAWEPHAALERVSENR